MIRYIQILVLLAVCTAAAQSQVVVEIRTDVDERNFMPYELPMLIDSGNALTFNEIKSPSWFNKFNLNDGYQNKDFLPNASYWIRLPIRHTTNTSKVWLLEFYDRTIDHVDAYIPQEDGSYSMVSMGDELPFLSRLIPHKNFEVVLNMKSDGVRYYYFRIQSREFADIRVALRSANRFIHYALNEYFLFGTFYGMILIIILYNLLVYLAIREIKNLLYVLYLFSVAAYAVSLDGIGFQYLWPNHPEWNDYATGVALYGVIVSSLLFTRRFLRTRSIAPTLDRLFTLMIVARTAWFVIALVILPQHLPFRVADI